MTIERDELGFDAPAPLGHPGRIGLPAGHATGPEIGEGGGRLLSLRGLVTPVLDAAR